MVGIFQGMDALTDKLLGLSSRPDVSHAVYQSLATLIAGEAQIPQENLVDRLLNHACDMWDKTPEMLRGRSSPLNWQSGKAGPLTPGAHSATSLLNRAIANSTDGRWSNLVPVDAGLWGRPAGRKLALLERAGDDANLIELSVCENTPLSLAVRGLQHVVVYLFYRTRFSEVGYPGWNSQVPNLLDADRLSLAVLAPTGFYDRYVPFAACLNWLNHLEHKFNRDLRNSSACQAAGVTAAFRFECFPTDFEWSDEYAHSPESSGVISSAFARRRRYFPN
jgi:hypothetical protein